MMKSIKPYEKYKDSGVSWIGNIPESWEVVKLGTFFSERREKVSDEEFKPLSVTKNGVVPQLENAAKTMHGDNRKKVCKGDFVIAKEDGSVSVINIALKPRDINPKYSEYLLKNYFFKEEYYRFGRGIVADLWTTRYSEMKNMGLPKTNPKEQEKIANFLDYKTAKIDRFIGKKKQLIKLLNEQKAGIINDAVTKGLNPNARTKPSGIEWLGDIPEHWEIVKLTGLCDLVRGNSSFKKDELLSNGKYVALQYGKTYKVNEVDEKYQFYVNDDFYKVSQIVNCGDIIFISTSETIKDLGHSVFYSRSDLGLLGGEQIVLKPKNNIINGKYLC